MASGYVSTKILKMAYNKLVEICHKWRETGIPLAVPSEHQSAVDISLCSIKNTRRKMEDRHITVNDLNLLFGLKVTQLTMLLLDNQSELSYFFIEINALNCFT